MPVAEPSFSNTHLDVLTGRQLDLSVPSSHGHIVVFAYEAWGHARPLCNLAARLVQSRNIIVTFFTTPAFYDRVMSELLRNFDADGLGLDRIRVITLIHTGMHSLDNTVLNDSFAQAFDKLAEGDPVQCVHTGVTHEPVSPPKAVIIDFFGLPLLQAVRRLSGVGEPIKVFVWFAGAAAVVFRLCAPERLGGIGNLRAKSEEEAIRKHVRVEQAAGDIALGNDGAVVRIPGLPAIYDYEIEPQKILGGRALTGAMCLAAYEVFETCDGIILASPESYEPETTAALRQWMAGTSRPVYCAGPMIAQGTHADSVEKGQSESIAEVDDFLESTMKHNGKRSLLYISFGTVYWSMEPKKIWTFLDVVLELRIPFIMSHSSRWATVPEEVADKVSRSGNGLLVRYSPQQHILNHPATGWFLTHGGHNSIIEAICAGVPMICWPFSFDQPLNAIHLTENLNVAYEIFQGRTGPGLKPIHRLGKAPEGTLDSVKEEAREILLNAFGEDGIRKRENVQALRQRTLDARSKRGTSTHDIHVFLDTL
ncbi:uncharacterized protein C8Q71DRAFT_258990 [Rhodofomes roseus]|uniref:Uncharacterized protein n=1 Tax=Rhodofomes roseus TaxID=34475 RepID=A0ABQ8K786_9APHY|nr:uncharacterized protein C8Q71DRAFT_258990 [Rhodofomes roseus]KAH9832558.1 hypothetical protein C8Q71DRAFT_258990 [Rhodofomes roseus]